jgi:Zn-dependent protease with chaperone function
MKKIFVIPLIINLLIGQDKIVLLDGKIINGTIVKRANIEYSNNIEFIPNGWEISVFYNKDDINFVKSHDGKLLFPKNVVANFESGLYHLPHINHLPPEKNRILFESAEDAIKAGYSPCKACFDIRPTLSDFTLERRLAKQTIIEIKNQNEILYEHSSLPKLQSIVTKILNNWVEPLEGYNYRVQVIRDDEPNALAVAGGNIYVTSGLLDIVENDDELEFILAHEIAHIERRHLLRQFKEFQRKQAGIKAVMALLIIATSNNENNQFTADVIEAMGTFATALASSGYERRLEQEADLFAQLYFKKQSKEINPIVTTLDKLITYSLTRTGSITINNAFSSHPDLTARLNQTKHGYFHTYDQPLIMSFQPVTPSPINKKQKYGQQLINQAYTNNIQEKLFPGFLELRVNNVYKVISSNKDDEDEILLLGTIKNNHSEMSFKINSIKLNFLGSLGITELHGIVDLVIPTNSQSEFVGRIKSPKDISAKVEDSVYNKRILPFGVNISAVILQPGVEVKKVSGFQNITCAMIVK